MKTVFDKITRDDLIKRINSLNENSKPICGKMNIYEMMNHIELWQQMMLVRIKSKRVFIGRFFWKSGIKKCMKR